MCIRDSLGASEVVVPALATVLSFAPGRTAGRSSHTPPALPHAWQIARHVAPQRSCPSIAVAKHRPSAPRSVVYRGWAWSSFRQGVSGRRDVTWQKKNKKRARRGASPASVRCLRGSLGWCAAAQAGSEREKSSSRRHDSSCLHSLTT